MTLARMLVHAPLGFQDDFGGGAGAFSDAIRNTIQTASRVSFFLVSGWFSDIAGV